LDKTDDYVSRELEDQVDDSPCDDNELDGTRKTGRMRTATLPSRRSGASETFISIKRDGRPAIAEILR